MMHKHTEIHKWKSYTYNVKLDQFFWSWELCQVKQGNFFKLKKKIVKIFALSLQTFPSVKVICNGVNFYELLTQFYKDFNILSM